MARIELNGLSKAYRKYPSKWHRLAEWISPMPLRLHEQSWVLKGIDLRVEDGQAIGVLGLNGAGKSTLLKAICGTTSVTAGTIKVKGRVTAMLELGLGFHPEFTGRQNLSMAGQLIGLTADQISHLLPEIEKFAEIGRFIDEPVRVYSSGMQVRLAFALATAVRPDVLIVDEALSVGDIYFQHKSLTRIKSFIEQGTSLLFVSHDTAAIQTICNRAILLKHGEICADGKPEYIANIYNAMIADQESNLTVATGSQERENLDVTSGTGQVKLIEASLRDESGFVSNAIGVGSRVSIKVKLRFEDSLKDVTVGYLIKNKLGLAIFGTNTAYLGATSKNIDAGEIHEFEFNFSALLGEGTYSISIAVHSGTTHLAQNYLWQDHAIVFDVMNRDRFKFVGLAWLPTEAVTRKAQTSDV